MLPDVKVAVTMPCNRIAGNFSADAVIDGIFDRLLGH
jgi:hypothetical protein